MRIGAIMHNRIREIKTSFSGANFLLRQGPSIDNKELEFEITQAQRARNFGVSVPKYKIQHDKNDGSIRQIRYSTEGDSADIDKNPISSRHFRNLLKNLYYMDAAGIFHNNLNPKHIFFQHDGCVEIDDFRHSTYFYKGRFETRSLAGKELREPDFKMPSNEESFREHCLSRYIEDVAENDRNYFMRRYLQTRSEYHQRRSDLLLRRGFSPNSKTVKYETVQSFVFNDPSRRVVSFETDKLNIYKQKEEALEQWAMGVQAKDNTPEPGRRFNSVLLYLDCIENAANLRDVAEYFAENSKTEEEREYFKFELECAQKRLADMCLDALDMGRQNFNDTQLGIFLGTQDEKEFFTALFKETDFNNSARTKEGMEDVKEYYSCLIEKWDKNLNKHLAEEYQNS